MSNFIVTGPDNKKYKVNAPEGANQDDATNYINNKYYRPREQAGFISSIKDAASILTNAPAALRFSNATEAEKETARKALLAGNESKYDTTAFQDISGVGSAIDWAKQVAGSTVGALAVPIATGAVTGGIGAGAALASQYTTQNLIRQAQEQERAIQEGRAAEDTSVGKALVGAGVQTGLDIIGFKFFKPVFSKFPIVGKMFGSEGDVVAKESEEILADAFKNQTLKLDKGIVRGFGGGVAFEIPQEIAQQATERWQAGLSLTGDDARSEYIEAGAGAILLGGTLGASSTFMQNKAKRDTARAIIEAKDLEKAEEEKKITDAESAAKAAAKAAKVTKTSIPLDQLDKAIEAITPINEETNVGEYKNKIIEATGSSITEANKIFNALVNQGKVTKIKEGDKKGLYKIATEEVIVPSYDAADPTIPELGDSVSSTDATTPTAAADVDAAADVEAATTPVTTIAEQEVEDAGLTPDINSGTDAGSLGVLVPSDTTGKLGTPKIISTGVADPRGNVKGANEGKKVSEASLRKRVKDLRPKTPLSDIEAEVVKDVSKIEQTIYLLRKGEDSKNLSTKLNLDKGRVEDILADLQAGVTVKQKGKDIQVPILNADNTLNKDAFKQDNKNVSPYDKYLIDKESPLQALGRLINDINTASNDVNKKAKFRVIDRKITELEENVIKPIETDATQAAILKSNEVEAQARSQRIVDKSENLINFDKNKLEEVVLTKDANSILDYIINQTTENFKKITDSTTIAASNAAVEEEQMVLLINKLNDITLVEKNSKLTDKERGDYQKNKRILKENIDKLAKKSVKVNSFQSFKDSNNLVLDLTKQLKESGLSSVEIQVEGDASADVDVFNRLKNENKIAEYSPKTNILHITKDGLSPKVILHEMVHAATVRVLHVYETAPEKLTETQREAAEHINKIYAVAKLKLKYKFPNAFENVYEFVSYAMTEPKFQQELSLIRRPSLALYTKQVLSLWAQFSRALMDMFGLTNLYDINTQFRSVDAYIKYYNIDPRLVKSTSFRNEIAQIILEAKAKQVRGNLLVETAEAFQYILTVPEKGVNVAPLPTISKTDSKTDLKVEEELNKGEAGKIANENSIFQAIKTALTPTQAGYENLARTYQDDRRPLKKLEDDLRNSGTLKILGEAANNLYSLLILSPQRSSFAMAEYLQTPMDNIQDGINAYAKARGITIEKALDNLSTYFTARHEKERRFVKFLLNVPLNNAQKFKSTILGTAGTAADLREFILKELNNNFEFKKRSLNRELTKEERKNLAEDYYKVLQQLSGYRNGLEVNNGYRDINGVSTINKKSKSNKMPINQDAVEYRVGGPLEPEVLDKLRSIFENEQKDPTLGKILEKIDANFKVFQNNSIELDKQAKYWSAPVDNFKNFYNFQNYVPFKGKPESKVSEGDERFEYDGTYLGREDVEVAKAFGGRSSAFNNVILQTFVDGTRSSMRWGRKGAMQAAANLIKSGDIIGLKKPKIIKFADRYLGLDPKDLQSQNKIFNYKEDGTIEIWTIEDKRMLAAIRREYEAPNPLWDRVNSLTSFVGHMHTRYNPAFYPYNFVRDALTNAFTMGVDMGPSKGLKYLDAIGTQIFRFGMFKTGRIAKLYAEGKIDEIRKLAKNDTNVKDLLELLETGGRMSYLTGFAIKDQINTTLENVGKGNFASNKKTMNKWIDVWADSFELTSRAAAYSVVKAEAIANGLTEEEAKIEAAVYALELANFSKVGTAGKKAGALFMFFRPAATGAVRVLDSIAPLFQDFEVAKRSLPESVRNNPVALDKYKKHFFTQRKNAKSMLLGITAAGFMLYTMAFMASDDDDEGRNKVATDDMALWTRNFRVPIGKETLLQLPWGFGLGAFLAAGAQIAGVAYGKTSLTDMSVNMTNIALDSFMPLPISRIDPREHFSAWIVDSISPSVARPLVQFAMNVDGLSREIYNDRQTKYGDAYTGGKNVPEMWKQASAMLFEVSDNQISVQPNTLHFWANNYIDGITRIAQNGLGIGMFVAGSKDFDAKNDLLPFSSFVGRKGNFDARQFADVEKQILDKRERLRAVENMAKLTGNIEPYRNYINRNPNDPAIVYIYNKQINSNIRDIRATRNSVQSNPNYTIGQKKEYIDQLDIEQNYIKRGLIDVFAQYNVKP